MATFGERLKELRKSKNITQKDFATILHVTERAYQNYEMNSSTPNYKLLLTIADYFNVSLDYLVGRTDDPELHTLKSKE